MPDYNAPHETARGSRRGIRSRKSHAVSEMAAMRRTSRTPRLLHDVKPHARGWRFRSVVEPLAPATSGQAAAPRPGRLIRTMVTWVALAMVMVVATVFLISFSWSSVEILAQRRGVAPSADLDKAVMGLALQLQS